MSVRVITRRTGSGRPASSFGFGASFRILGGGSISLSGFLGRRAETGSMSISRFFRTVGRVAQAFEPRIQGQAPQVPTPVNIFSSVPNILANLPQIIRDSRGVNFAPQGGLIPRGPLGGAGQLPALMGAADTAGCPKGFHMRKNALLPPKCVRNRRMNPCNARALSKAVRRLNSYTKLNKRIEKAVRKACPPRRSAPRRVPGHRAQLTHD